MLPEKLAVCQLAVGTRVPEWVDGIDIFSVTQTAEELSVVCGESRVPAGIRAERDWVGLKLEGPFPFDMTGVLSSFLQPLAEAGIPIFAASTFDTDYVLVKRENLESAVAALEAASHQRIP